MRPEILKKLFASSNVHDVNIALELVSRKTYVEIAEILGQGYVGDYGSSWHNQIVIELHPSLHKINRSVKKAMMDYNIHFKKDRIKFCKIDKWKLELPL